MVASSEELGSRGSTGARNRSIHTTIQVLIGNREVKAFTSGAGCSWTADLCSSGTAATPTDNKNTAASGNKRHITFLSARPLPPPTMRGIIASKRPTEDRLRFNLCSANHLISSATKLANFILATYTIRGTPC